VGRIVGLVVLATIATALLALSSLPRGGTQTANVRPEYIPETYVDFTCYHSEITLDGVVACHDQSIGQPSCGSPQPPTTCSYTIKDVPDSGYTFSSWSTSGEASISGSTLYVHVPGVGRYMGYVTANVS